MRKVYLLPNFVTTANMFCGFYAIISAMQGDLVFAAWLIVAAGVFDAMDGRVARLAKATSQFGVEYDSLSDLVSFGVAPAIIAYQWGLTDYGRVGWLVTFLFLVCGALRLARFNVFVAKLPCNFFQGLPIPIAAGLVVTFIIFHSATGWPQEYRSQWTLLIVLLLGVLMISTIPFPSFKKLNWRSRASFGFLMTGVISMVLIAIRPELTLFGLLAVYVSLSLIWNLFRILGFKVYGSQQLSHPEHST